MPTTIKTREAWLLAAVSELRPLFRKAGHALPRKIRVGVGFTSRGVKAIGEAWDPKASAQGVHEVFLSVLHKTPLELLDTLAHELVHVAVGVDKKHGPAFRSAALAIGMVGPMRSAGAGPDLLKQLKKIEKKLGPIPYGPVDATRRKKQGTRLLKVACVKKRCKCGGYVVRVTRTWITVGLPRCPFGSVMRESD